MNPWDGTCLSCGHATPHKRLGPIKDSNGFKQNDACEECECINDPSFDTTTHIRHSLDDHAFEPTAFPRSCGYRATSGQSCWRPKSEHLLQQAVQ